MRKSSSRFLVDRGFARIRALAAFATLAFALAVAANAPESGGAAPADASRVDEVKAAYLINFLRYTEWPASSFPSADSPFRVLVAGRPELLDATRRLAGAAGRVSGRTIDVERIALPPAGVAGSELRAELAARLRNCHLLFIDRQAFDRADEPLALVRDFPVLTVSDLDRFAESGGMLELLPRGSNIVLAANPAAIRRSDLVVSAKVLKLAQLVGSAEVPR